MNLARNNITKWKDRPTSTSTNEPCTAMAAATATLHGAFNSGMNTKSSSSCISCDVQATTCRLIVSSKRSHVRLVARGIARTASVGLWGTSGSKVFGNDARKDCIAGFVSGKSGQGMVEPEAFGRNSREGFGVEVGNVSPPGKASSVGKSRIGFVVQAGGTNGREEILSDGSFLPVAEFYKVEAIVRPWRLSHVAAALIESGIRGVTVTDVRGFGSQGVSRERHAGSEFSEDSFVTKVKLEVVVSKDQVEVVINKIIDEARTGEIGDGKIFVIPVSDVIRVRTGERGLKAERMAGGRADLLSSKISQADVY